MIFNPAQVVPGYFDLALEGSDLATGNELESAVILSLFTNRRAEPDDILPDSVTDRQGWWGDDFPTKDMDKIGSRLWLLNREKQTTDTLTRAAEYAAEALQWFVDDGVASGVKIQASYPQRYFLALGVELTHGDNTSSRFEFLWDQLKSQILPFTSDSGFKSGVTYLVTENGAYLTTEDGAYLTI